MADYQGEERVAGLPGDRYSLSRCLHPNCKRLTTEPNRSYRCNGGGDCRFEQIEVVPASLLAAERERGSVYKKALEQILGLAQAIPANPIGNNIEDIARDALSSQQREGERHG